MSVEHHKRHKDGADCRVMYRIWKVKLRTGWLTS